MRIPASVFAETARQLFQQAQSKHIPYRRGGGDMNGMDCCGFIMYCLRQHSITCNFTGTNDMFRGIGGETIPLREAHERNLIMPGILLFHVSNDGGEPGQYKADRLGNADYAAVCVSQAKAVYASNAKNGIIETQIDKEPIPGRLNNIVLCRYISYPGSDNAPSSTQPTLRLGSCGADVIHLQQQLQKAGYPVSMDGIFGSETDKAVRAFQGKLHLFEDGIVGALTWAQLCSY